MREIKFRAWNEVKQRMEHDVYKEYQNLMQYTGLKDKNGKEIYEGDILKVEGSKRLNVVQWDEEEFGYVVSYSYANGRPGNLVLADFCALLKVFEVIGNIHENPELLKG